MKKRFIANFIVIALATSLIIGFFSYQQQKKMMMSDLGERLLSIADSAAVCIDAEIHDNLHQGDENTPQYQESIQKLRQIQERTGVAYLYTMKREGGALQFVLDADPEEPAAIEEEYETDVVEKEMELAFNGQSSYNPVPFTDQWGTFISAYAPVFDGDGKVVAILGVDLSVENVLASQKKLALQILLLIIPAILLALFIGYKLASSLIKPINTMVSAVEEIAEHGGDLTKKIEIDTGDELEQMSNATNKVLVTIGSIVKEIAATVKKLNDTMNYQDEIASHARETASQVAVSIQQLSDDARDQASSAEKAKNSLETISSSISNISGAIHQLNEETRDVEKNIHQGSNVVKHVVSQMNEIRGTMDRTKTAVSHLGKRSAEINQIVQIINEIADQTNLLALNAAIEAARAGEQGRGFAVVAEEVRKLAEQSQSSVGGITDLVQQIQKETSETVSAIEAGTEEALKGSHLVTEAEAAFKKIQKGMEAVSIQQEEINRLNEKIGYESSGVTREVENMAMITQENTLGIQNVNAVVLEQQQIIEGISVSVQDLQNVIQQLNQVLRKFTV